MSHQALSIEEIDAHLIRQAEALNTKDFAGLDLCKIYKTVRPILEFAKLLLFFRPKWQAVLQSFLDAADKMCP
jgi:hypothetical protein